jgi:hypothetical protein
MRRYEILLLMVWIIVLNFSFSTGAQQRLFMIRTELVLVITVSTVLYQRESTY